MATRRRQKTHPDEARIEASRLYEVDGLMPGQIQRSLAEDYGEIPLDTVKGWLRGKQRGAGVDEPYTKWDFAKATPAERRMIAPLFAAEHLRTYITDDGDDFVGDPEDIWPSQAVGDWFIRFRQLVPEKAVGEVYHDARHVAMLDRRVEAGVATGEDVMIMRGYVAAYLAEAGARQAELLEDTGAGSQPNFVELDTDPDTGELRTIVLRRVETPR